MKRVLAMLICLLLLCGVFMTPASAAGNMEEQFMKTAFMISRYQAFFEKGAVDVRFVNMYLEHIAPEMRTYEVIREPYYNIVHLWYAVPVEEYEAIVAQHFELTDRIRTELQENYYREDAGMYYLPCNVIDAVHNFSWYDYAGYVALGDGLYEIYARRTDNVAAPYTDLNGLTEGVDYVREIEHRRRFHPTLQVAFLKAEVYNRPVKNAAKITVRLQDGVPQLISAEVCDAKLTVSEQVVTPTVKPLSESVVNLFLPEEVSCSNSSALPNGACLIGKQIKEGDTFARAKAAVAGGVSRFAVYDLSAVDDMGEAVKPDKALTIAFELYGDSSRVYRLGDDGYLQPLGGRMVSVDELGVYVVTDGVLPTSKITTATTVSVSTASTSETTASTATAAPTTAVTATTVTTAAPTQPTAPVQQDDGNGAAVWIAVGCAAVAVLAVALVLLKKKQK